MLRGVPVRVRTKAPNFSDSIVGLMHSIKIRHLGSIPNILHWLMVQVRFLTFCSGWCLFMRDWWFESTRKIYKRIGAKGSYFCFWLLNLLCFKSSMELKGSGCCCYYSTTIAKLVKYALLAALFYALQSFL